MAELVQETAVAAGAGTHPIVVAIEALRPEIRALQPQIEADRRLPLALVEKLRAAGAYRLLVPRAFGGAQVDLNTAFRAIEAAAEGDGAVGWNLSTSSALTTVALALPVEGVEEIYAAGPDVVGGGTTGIGPGKAVKVDGGYVSTGRWRFGSGCQECDWLGGALQVFDGGEPRLDADGSPVYVRLFFRAPECAVIDTWDVTGMQGTGSHDWTVSEVFVPERRADLKFGRWSRWPGTLYATPWQAFAGCHFSAVATGIARTAIDALIELASTKKPVAARSLLRERAQVQEWVGRAEALLGSAKAYRTIVQNDIWETAASGAKATREQQARCRLAASYAVENAVQATDLMYRAAGTTAIERGNLLGRCWRDVHVVAQNFNVDPEFYEIAGRVFLGLEPGPKLG